MALSANRSTLKMPPEGVIPDLSYVPVAASTKIYQGGLVCLDANGRCIVPPTSGGVGKFCIGRSEVLADNSSGAAGAISATVRSGAFKWANSLSGDAITQAHLGWTVYAVDDQTVALTDGNGTRAIAGKVCQVDTDGVWVVSGFITGLLNSKGWGPALGSVVSWVFDLADISAADIVAKFIPGFSGRIASFQATVLKAATTGAKAATITPQINPAGGADAPVTGGGLALTSNNMTPIGAVVAAAAITGANTFGPTDGISLLGSAVTAFVEGRVQLSLTLA